MLVEFFLTVAIPLPMSICEWVSVVHASYLVYCCAQIRLVVVGLGGLLTRVRYMLQCLPLYVSILWMLQSAVISSKYQVEDRFRIF